MCKHVTDAMNEAQFLVQAYSTRVWGILRVEGVVGEIEGELMSFTSGGSVCIRTKDSAGKVWMTYYASNKINSIAISAMGKLPDDVVDMWKVN